MLNQKEKISQIERIDNITCLLDKFNEVSDLIADLHEQEALIKFKLTKWLKEHKWNRYVDEKNHISMTLEQKHEKSIDLVQLKYYLKPNELQQVTKYRQSEVLNVITPRMKMRMKDFVKVK